MIGFVSIKQRKIYLKDKEFSYTEKEFKNQNLLAEFADIRLWLTDAPQMIDISNYRFKTPHSAYPMTIADWDCFSIISKVTQQQIIQNLAELPRFFPAIANFSNNEKDVWKFTLPDLDCELEQGIQFNTSTSKTLNTNIDVLDFYLWLVQQDILVPKGKPIQGKRTLNSIVADQSINLGLYVKREQVERYCKKNTPLINNHWQSEWINASWLKMILFDDLNIEREVDVLEYEEIQSITHLLPAGFDLTWLFCPAAHFVLYRYAEFLSRSENHKTMHYNLFCILMGNFIYQKLQQLNNQYLKAEFNFLHWQTKQEKKSSSKDLANRYN